ncbi:MAG: hypothetical protein ACE361_15205 [Aureliella sp.]
MAKCDEGYLCEACGAPVERLSESALYLQYILGWIDAGLLQTSRECHLKCMPALAQFVRHPEFEEVFAEGDFDRRQMDPKFVAERTELVTGAYQRLVDLQRKRKGLTLDDYPL